MSATIYRVTAMKDANVPIETLCIHSKYVVFRGGLKLRIRYINEHDELTDDIMDAVAYEFGNKRIGWATHPFDYMNYEIMGEWEH
jgi:hypothetical protein